MEEYITIKHGAEASIEEKRSVFIANISPASNDEEAISFINSVKKKYPDAKHNVYAYILRNNNIMRYSDDREPQGTAGIPVLEVMRKSGITNAVIVVTRYFGGILLGTGGLVRAYTAAAKMAIDSAELAVLKHFFVYSLNVNYHDYQKVMQSMNAKNVKIEETDFADSIKLKFLCSEDDYDSVIGEITDITSEKSAVEKIGEKFDFINL